MRHLYNPEKKKSKKNIKSLDIFKQFMVIKYFSSTEVFLFI